MPYKNPELHREKESLKTRNWYQANKERARMTARANQLKAYGLTEESYQSMLTGQGGSCAICGNGPPTGRRLSVDHDHETGVIRGLLCTNCNRGLGLLGDTLERLTKAVRYLERNS